MEKSSPHWELQVLELIREVRDSGHDRFDRSSLSHPFFHAYPQAVPALQTAYRREIPRGIKSLVRRLFRPNRYGQLAGKMAQQLELPLRTQKDPAHPEWDYVRLMRKIWETGDKRVDRTGVGTRSIFGAKLRFSLADDRIPLLTTKRVSWKTAAREMLWFLTGETNIRPLVLQGVKIWNEWPHARYVLQTGNELSLEDFVARIASDEKFARQWGDLGPVYGKQWVNWATYEPMGDGTFRQGPGINQVAQVVASLKINPTSRRHIIEGWNVAELDQMALPPCHKTYQFHVAGDRLNCLMYQRSCDVVLGLPFNLFGAALLTRMMADQTGYLPGSLIWMGGDTHLYLNHLQQIQEQLDREPVGEPKLVIKRKPADIFGYQIDDFEVRDYTPHGALKAPVAV